MKKLFSVLLSVLVLVVCSCDNHLIIKESQPVVPKEEKLDYVISKINTQINQYLKQSESRNMLSATDSPNVLNLKDSDLTEAELKDFNCFINGSVESLYEDIDLSNEETEDNVELLYSIYSESTIDDVIKKMEVVSPEMADEYKSSVSDFYESLSSDVRCAINQNGGIRAQKLYVFDDSAYLEQSRKIEFALDLSWASVNRYVGYSAAAIAGASLYKWGIFRWIRYPGLATCLASVSCMGVLLARWICSDELKVVSKVISYTVDSAMKIKNLTSLTDSKKRETFLGDVSKKLQNYLSKNPEYASSIKKILSFIEEECLGVGSLHSAVHDLILFCFNDGVIAKQLVTVGVSTGSVVTYCWFTGVVAFLQDAYYGMIDFIPRWISITQDSIVIIINL